MAHEWKVRSMDETVSRSAVAAAEKAGVNTAVWLADAIREKLTQDRRVLTGEVLAPNIDEADEGRVDPISPVARPEVQLDDLVRIAATTTLPQWLRSGAAKHIATTIGVSWPARGPRKALQAPEDAVAVAAAAEQQAAVDELLGV